MASCQSEERRVKIYWYPGDEDTARGDCMAGVPYTARGFGMMCRLMNGSSFPEEIAGAPRFAWGAPTPPGSAVLRSMDSGTDDEWFCGRSKRRPYDGGRNDVPVDGWKTEPDRITLRNPLFLRSAAAAKGQVITGLQRREGERALWAIITSSACFAGTFP